MLPVWHTAAVHFHLVSPVCEGMVSLSVACTRPWSALYLLSSTIRVSGACERCQVLSLLSPIPQLLHFCSSRSGSKYRLHASWSDSPVWAVIVSSLVASCISVSRHPQLDAQLTRPVSVH